MCGGGGSGGSGGGGVIGEWGGGVGVSSCISVLFLKGGREPGKCVCVSGGGGGGRNGGGGVGGCRCFESVFPF